MKVVEAGLEGLDEVVKCIRESGRSIVLLTGDLASGKTTLVQAFAKALGQEGATSPTFAIQQIYGDRIFHYDLYTDPAKFFELGLFEELGKEGYHFIEWPSRELKAFLKEAGFAYLEVAIEAKGEKRIYRCIDS
ncbi:MAG: tRNA (adenosine(37)-N6)-threonylcarbamoyltransferase complex ATPase subunit type 1 TsaE [Nitratiruptor sp.]|nr:tRNA (adenosine(37)-N6)-threonylcarbamoyltransferase complex ATPase subunit type 1 TsaE [Nitratiruptor sp.]NPA84072.1 tRNA (adenosine(37)-N6)-threonylcarbamoyltransferase complex ATPase subunit type 1 TsaE [Campylobacterota bacterium]